MHIKVTNLLFFLTKYFNFIFFAFSSNHKLNLDDFKREMLLQYLNLIRSTSQTQFYKRSFNKATSKLKQAQLIVR